jgi:hypothetical protein
MDYIMRMRSWKVQRLEGSVVSVESFHPSRNDVSVESFQPFPSSNLSPNLSVESFQPFPSSNLSPDFKAERTTHGILPHQLPPFVVHSAAKIETYSDQFMAESTPNLTSANFQNIPTFQPSNPKNFTQ